MARILSALLAFNRGLISRLGLARIDLKRLALSAEVMVNWMPRVLGSMMLRPGLIYRGATRSNLAARFVPFIFATDDTALLEFTDQTLRIWINDALISRPNVTTAVANGTFSVNLTGWTDNDETGCFSTWASPSYMQLVGDGTNSAIRDQAVTVSGSDIGVEHALRIVIPRGPVSLRVGTSLGSDEYIRETALQTGVHSLAFTPSGTFYIRFFSSQIPLVWVDNCTIEAAGLMTLTTPYLTADLDSIRTDQSADVIFVACDGYQQRRIERRAARSWSVVLYLPPDGPFRTPNVSTITLTPAGISGNVTLASSDPLFRPGHVGALFSIDSSGQYVSTNISAQDTFTDSIRVAGIGANRAFTIFLSAVGANTVTLQQSVGTPGVWTDVMQWTADTVESYNDTLDNQIIYYRAGIKTGDYSAGTTGVQLRYGSGSITGIIRITTYSTSILVAGEVLQAFGSAFASSSWSEGSWSDVRGWPSAVALFEGRLWWSGKSGIYGSISDAYDAFDPNFLGDAGPINRTVGSGPVDTINWLLPLQRLIVGGPGAEYACRASTLDQPLTPTNFNIRKTSTQGSGNVEPVLVDLTGIFVQRGGYRVYKLQFNSTNLNYEYSANHMSELVPDIGSPGIVRVAVQRQPDTRIHFVRSDGTAAILIYDQTEDVNCWVNFETDGLVEDVVVLPAMIGEQDDYVYYVVRRTIDGNTVRYLERFAQEINCHGDDLCFTADSLTSYSGLPTTTMTGLAHLEGETVTVWADGLDVGTKVVTGNQITITTAASNIVVGLPYTAQFKSTKLGQALQGIEVPLNQHKKINHIGLILADSYSQGLQFGPDFDYLDYMPEIEEGTSITEGTSSAYDQPMIEFPGTYTTDLRLCLQVQSPRPCTVLAATVDMEIHR